MTENKGLLSRGFSMVGHNKRYIVWFYLLNLVLAWFGTTALRSQADSILGHSLLSQRIVHGFDVAVLGELLARPEFGPAEAATTSSVYFAFVFFLASVVFLPGVFQGYASNYRLPREDFFRACGRNLWRYIRLLIVAGIVMGIVAAALFGLHGLLEKKAGESTNELLLPEVRLIGLAIIFLVMTTMRIWFDLAEVDVVLSDQRAVRKSIGAGFRHTFRSLIRLLASYVAIAVVAMFILSVGLLIWLRMVGPEKVGVAWVVSQLMLLLLLIPRFWQRGVAVAYYQEQMVAPVVVMVPITPARVVEPVVVEEPLLSPLIPNIPPPEPA